MKVGEDKKKERRERRKEKAEVQITREKMIPSDVTLRVLDIDYITSCRLHIQWLSEAICLPL